MYFAVFSTFRVVNESLTLMPYRTTTLQLTDNNVNTCYRTKSEDKLIQFFTARKTLGASIELEFSVSLVTHNFTLCQNEEIRIVGRDENTACDGTVLKRKCFLNTVSPSENSCDFVCECKAISCEFFVAFPNKEDVHLCELQM